MSIAVKMDIVTQTNMLYEHQSFLLIWDPVSMSWPCNIEIPSSLLGVMGSFPPQHVGISMNFIIIVLLLLLLLIAIIMMKGFTSSNLHIPKMSGNLPERFPSQPNYWPWGGWSPVHSL